VLLLKASSGGRNVEKWEEASKLFFVSAVMDSAKPTLGRLAGIGRACRGDGLGSLRKSCLFVPTFWSSSLLFPLSQLSLQVPQNVHPRVWLVPPGTAYTTFTQHREITQADITLHHAMI
jgi:hypothetical protein